MSCPAVGRQQALSVTAWSGHLQGVLLAVTGAANDEHQVDQYWK